MKKDYEALHPLRRDGVDSVRGSVVEMEESEASPLVQGGVLRELPERKSRGGRPRKQDSEEQASPGEE